MIEELPDNCLPPDHVLAILGFEKLPFTEREFRDRIQKQILNELPVAPVLAEPLPAESVEGPPLSVKAEQQNGEARESTNVKNADQATHALCDSRGNDAKETQRLSA